MERRKVREAAWRTECHLESSTVSQSRGTLPAIGEPWRLASVLRAETPRGWQKQRQRQHITQNATGPVLDVYERATFKIKRHNNSFRSYRASTPINCFLLSVHDRTRIRSKFRTVRRNVFPFILDARNFVGLEKEEKEWKSAIGFGNVHDGEEN